MLHAVTINKYYEEDENRLHVLKDISLEIKDGEFLMLLGPSGSGKSTLLRVLSGIEKPTTGHIKNMGDLKRAFIFQSFALFPWLTVSENIAFGLKMDGVPAEVRKKKVEEQVHEMGLLGFEHSYPRELSGGMKQRVGIARALAVDPDIIFLDEPFSALDSFNANRLRQELLQLWEKKKVTMVMVTHLVEEAALMADRVVLLTQIPAQIESVVENTLPRPRDHRSPVFFELCDRLESVIKI